MDFHPADRVGDDPGIGGRAGIMVVVVVVVATARPVLVGVTVTRVLAANDCRPGSGRVGAGPRCSGDRQGGVSHDRKVKDHFLRGAPFLLDARPPGVRLDLPTVGIPILGVTRTGGALKRRSP